MSQKGIEISHYKVLSLPTSPEKNSVFYVLDQNTNKVSTYITDLNGVPIPLIDLTTIGSVLSITGTAVTGSATNPTVNISNFVSTQLGNQVYLSSTDGKLQVNPITSPNNSIEVTATSTELQLQLSASIEAQINSALQPGANISELTNDIGYLTLADLPPTFPPASHTHPISDVVNLQTILNSKVDENAPIAGGTKTKITFDSKGLVTGAVDATTADIADTANKRYVTDADLVDLGNLSGVNSGDQNSIVGISGTKAEFDAAVTDGNFLYVGDITQYTDELAQDAIGAILTDTATIDFTYNDAGNQITADVKPNSIDATHLADNINVSEFINDADYATETYVDAKVTQTITDGVTLTAPSEDAVFDALDPLKRNASTGLLSGGVLSINTDSTKWDLATGTGYIVNSLTGVIITVNWSTQTTLTTPYLTTDVATFVLIDNTGAYVLQPTFPTQEQFRTHIYLGKLAHTTLTTILSVVTEPVRMFDSVGQIQDLNSALGSINIEGNVIGYNGANLNINCSAGMTYRSGANYINSRNSPSITTENVFTAGTFRRKYRNGTGGWSTVNSTAIDPNNYDNGSGTLQAVPSNKWTVQVFYRFGGSGVIHCDYGQVLYDNKEDALRAAGRTLVDEDPSTKQGASRRAWLVVKQGVTTLDTILFSEFIQADKLGEVTMSDSAIDVPQSTSTAVITGCTIVNNTTTFAVTAGVAEIVSNTYPPTRLTIAFPGVTGIVPLYLRTFVYIDNTGTVQQFNGAAGDLSPLQKRDNVFLGLLAFIGGSIVALQNIPSLNYDINGRFTDLADAIGVINVSGNVIGANGANLSINKGAGLTFRIASNYATERKVPDVTTDIAFTPIPAGVNLIGYRNGIGGWSYESYSGFITPDYWDDGTGVKATVNNNKFTIQRIYFFNGTNTFVIYLGQNQYSSMDEAVANVNNANRAIDPATSVASLRSSLVVKKGTTALNVTTNAIFLEGPKINGGASGSAISAQNFQGVYLNSVTPQITTNSTLGSVDFQRGSTADTDSVFRVLNGVSSPTFDVKGTGAITALSYNGFNPTTDLRNINTTSPLLGGGNLTADRTLSIQQATTSQNGYLSSTDWNTFNNKQPALGFTPENVANKATDFTVVNNTKYPTVQAVKTYADGLVAGLLDDRGSYNASVNTFPTTGGSGTAGAVVKGDLWYVSVAGTLGGQAVAIGDSFRALIDAPGQTLANWSILEGNIGYVPANSLRNINTNAPLLGGGNLTSDLTLYMPAATTSQSGYLTGTDWTTFNNKAPLASPTFTGTVTLPSTTSIGTVSSTEIGYVDGVTSAIQTQLDNKAPLTGGTGYIQNQNASAQSADMWISGNGRFGSNLMLSKNSGSEIRSVDATNSSYQPLTTLASAYNFNVGAATFASSLTTNGNLSSGGATPNTNPLYVKTATDYNFRMTQDGGVAQLACVNDAISAHSAFKLGNNWLNFTNTGAATFSSTVTVQGGVNYTDSVSTLSTDATLRTNLADPNQVIGIGLNSNNGGTPLIQSFRASDNSSRPILINPYGGNVGIGTTSPYAKLDNRGVSSNTTEDFVAGTTGSVLYYGTGATTGNTYGRIQVGNNGDNGTFGNLNLNPLGGNVGIGTTTPSHPLTILGADSTLPALGANGGKFGLLNGTVGGQYGIISGVLNNGNVYQQVQRIDGTATAYNLLLQPNGGNVGIGTTSPIYKLDIATDSSSGFRISSATSDTHIIPDFYGAGVSSILTGAGSKHLAFGISSTERMRITSGGNVGIGTTSPNGKLDVLSGLNTNSLTFNAASNAIFGSTIRQLSINSNDNSGQESISLQVRNNVNSASPLLLQPVGGNVGVGTTTPSAKIQVSKGSQNDTPTVANAAAYAYGADVGLAVGQMANAPYSTWIQSLRVSDNSSFPLNINPSGGNIIMGTNTDNGVDKLQVNGNVYSSGNYKIAAGNSLQFNSTAYMTPEDNVQGAKIKTMGSVLIESAGAVKLTNLSGTGTRTVVADASGNLSTGTTIYKVYVALMSQTGTDAPVATVLDNTLGGTVVWTRNSTGDYHATLTGAFTSGKTCVLVNGGSSFAPAIGGSRIGDNTVSITTKNPTGGDFADGIITTGTVEIRVYN